MRVMKVQLLSLIGPPGAPLRRIKDKNIRREVEQLLREIKVGPEIQLRAYLATGRTPPAKLVTEDNVLHALVLEDCVTFLPKLSRKTSVLQAEATLKAISQRLSVLRPANSYPLAIKLERIAKKWDGQSKRIALGDSTVTQFLRILEALCTGGHAAMVSRTGKKSQEVAPFPSLIKSGSAWALAWGSPPALLLVMRILGCAEKQLGIVIGDLLAQDPTFVETIDAVWEKCVEEIEFLATRGNVADLDQWARAAVRAPMRRKDTKAKLENLYADRGRFDESIQYTLADILGHRREGQPLRTIPIDEGETIQTGQLASVLLQAWSAKDEGPRAKEAFEQLQSLLSNFFGLTIRGKLGDIEPYNPRIHELCPGEDARARVRLLRPRVELARLGTSRVILKALVQKLGQVILPRHGRRQHEEKCQ